MNARPDVTLHMLACTYLAGLSARDRVQFLTARLVETDDPSEAAHLRLSAHRIMGRAAEIESLKSPPSRKEKTA